MNDERKWVRGDPMRTEYGYLDVRFMCTIRRGASIHNVYGPTQRYVIQKAEDLAATLDKAEAHPALVEAATAVCEAPWDDIEVTIAALRALLPKETP